MAQYSKAKEFAINLLRTKLPAYLTYHSIDHTRDVLRQASRIANEEKLTSREQIMLIKTAAIFHDCGFIKKYSGHEKAGCAIVKKFLPQFEYSNEQIDIICGMIMATKIPQTPRNLLEKIIADADMDYLGRVDFYKIGNRLKLELFHIKAINTELEWNKLQINFLNQHHYFTKFALNNREESKQKHLGELKKLVKHN